MQLPLELEVPRNYDLIQSVHSWIYPDIQPVPEMTGPGFFGRVFRIKGDLIPVIFRQNRPGQVLEITFPEDSTTAKDVSRLSRRILGLDKSMDSALLLMSRDSDLKRFAPSVKGIRPYLAESFHEALVKSIIQQQISYRSANVVTKRMILGLSKKQVFDGVELYSFPSPEEISSCGVDGLGKFGIGYRTEYVHRISSLVASGDLELESLAVLSFTEIMEILGPIRGIGEWTVQAAIVAGLGDLTIFPFGDLVIQNILGALYNNGVRMTKNQVIKKSEEWGREGPSILYLLMSAYVLGLAENQGKPKTHKR
ncbi:MAG: DNA-3-methyladenine glycosylase family protein [Candidatus Thorarchaeota archaeon]|jgi:DNA-3-methyladenine glycosylase II